MTVWGGDGHRYVVAEAGLNHNGDFELALRLIDIAAKAGADAIKFQKRHVPDLATADTLDAADHRFPSLGSTYREIRERHEFSLEQFSDLQRHALAQELDFFVTPFDLASLEFLRQMEVDRYKVASHSVTNLPLLEALAATGKPVLMSTGMATLEEVDDAFRILKSGIDDIALLHCVSSYPTPPEEARLDLIGRLLSRYQVPVGYSGHEIGYLTSLIAVGIGAQVIERHITTDRNLEGFDHHLSLDFEGFSAMVNAIREIETMFGAGEKLVTETEWTTRLKYQVSMVSARPLRKGELLDEKSYTFKNPGTGLTPSEAPDLLGRRTAVDIAQDTVLSRDMFE